jgi:hypothetical protein
LRRGSHVPGRQTEVRRNTAHPRTTGRTVGVADAELFAPSGWRSAPGSGSRWSVSCAPAARRSDWRGAGGCRTSAPSVYSVGLLGGTPAAPRRLDYSRHGKQGGLRVRYGRCSRAGPRGAGVRVEGWSRRRSISFAIEARSGSRTRSPVQTSSMIWSSVCAWTRTMNVRRSTMRTEARRGRLRGSYAQTGSPARMRCCRRAVSIAGSTPSCSTSARDAARSSRCSRAAPWSSSATRAAGRH